MKTNLVCAALACFVLAMTSTAGIAAIDPIPGVDIIVKKVCYDSKGREIRCPGGNIVIQAQTSSTGIVQYKSLLPGDNVIEIDGKSLVAAMDRLVPPAPSKKTGGSSFSFGIGGFLGGGSSRSNEGRGPVGADRNSGRIGGVATDPNDPRDNRVNNGGNSSSGVGLGMNIPIGGNGNSGSGGVKAPMISMTLTQIAPSGDTSAPDARGLSFSSETPYCRDTAGQGMKFGFKIADNDSPRPDDRIYFTVTIDWGDGTPQ